MTRRTGDTSVTGVPIELHYYEGNPYQLLGAASRTMKVWGIPLREIDTFLAEGHAVVDSWDRTLAVVMRWMDVR